MEKPKAVLGIDPGMSGAIAMTFLDRSSYAAWPMPILDKRISTGGMADLLDDIEAQCRIVHVVLERAIVLPKQGATSGLTIGINYGMLLGLLACRRYGIDEMLPKEWKRGLVVTPQVAAAEHRKKAAKEAAVAAARRLFPEVKFRDTQDGIAEALLMAEAARRTVCGCKENSE